MKEPLWRSVLCWGAVVTFLTLPLLLFVLVFLSGELGLAHFNQHLSDYRFLAPYFQSVTAVIFGLAGLNSFDRRTTTGRGEPQKQKDV